MCAATAPSFRIRIIGVLGDAALDGGTAAQLRRGAVACVVALGRDELNDVEEEIAGTRVPV